MNNTEIAKTIGKSRQMLEVTVSGKRNFGYQTARLAAEVFGGSTDIWQDSKYAETRKVLFKAFKSKFTKKKK